jgi:hypothetical protein
LILEGLSFAGFIGEPGESFMEWIDSHDNKAEWVKQTKQLSSNIRKYVSWDVLETFYEVAVDEEKWHVQDLRLGASWPCLHDEVRLGDYESEILTFSFLIDY